MKNTVMPCKKAFRPRSLVEARCGLKASENDILDMLLSYINRDDDIAENLVYTLVVDDFKNKFGLKYTNNAYGKIRNGVGQLKGKTIDIWSENGEKFESYVLFQTIRWHNGDGKITVKLGEDIKKMLVMQKQSITYYDIKYTLPMSSRYSKRFYVMFKEWECSSGKKRYDRIDDLREKLQVPESYTYHKFKTRVLEEAVREINGSTDIFVSYEEETKPVRGGYKVTGLIFSIRTKMNVTGQMEQDGAGKILDFLRSAGVTGLTSAQACIIYRTARKGKLTDRQIKNRIRMVLEKKNIKNIAGYLIFAMSDRFRSPEEVRKGFSRFGQRDYADEWFRLLEKSMLCPEKMTEPEKLRFDILTEQAGHTDSFADF